MATDKAKDAVTDRKILTIEEMLAADDVEYDEIPTWKVKGPNGEMVQGYTRIGSLSAEDIIEWRETGEDEQAKRNLGVRLFVNSLVDASGNRIGSAKHYEAFKRKSNAIQERVLERVLKLNGLTLKGAAKAKND